MLVLATGCSRQPAVSPERDWLVEWLMTSDTAGAIRSAAIDQDWLSGAPGEVADLHAAMSSVDVTDRRGLEAALGEHRDDAPTLFAALRLRRTGSTSGDLAHWVAVGLLVFAKAEPDRARIPTGTRWDEDYVADVFDLRAIAARGNLASAARPAGFDADPPPENLLFKPLSGVGRMAAREDQPSWPIFAAPGTMAVTGVASFAAGERVRWNDFRLMVQRSGLARALTDYVRTVAYYRLTSDGELEIEGGGNLALAADQELRVLTHNDTTLWVWVGDGRVASVPAECCDAPEGVQTLLWVRLARGEHAGGWTSLPTTTFEPVPFTMPMSRTITARRPRPPRLGEFMTARSATPTVAGAELVVWRDGAGDQAPLFVLHGGPGFGSAYLRQPLIDTLGDDLQLFFYDQRGSGYSGGLEDPSGLTMRRLVDDLELLRRRAELETLDLLGHSFGGLLAMHYAIAYPERVGRLVLVDSDPATYALWSQHADRLSGRLSAQDKALIEGLRANPAFGRDPGVMTAWVGLRMRGYTAVPDSADNIDFRLTAAVLENLTTTPGIIRADLGEWDVSGDLSKIRARTLVVAGGDSIFPVSAAEALARGIPNAQLSILPNVGHFPFIEDPDAFRQIVLEFLRQN